MNMAAQSHGCHSAELTCHTHFLLYKIICTDCLNYQSFFFFFLLLLIAKVSLLTQKLSLICQCAQLEVSIFHLLGLPLVPYCDLFFTQNLPGRRFFCSGCPLCPVGQFYICFFRFYQLQPNSYSNLESPFSKGSIHADSHLQLKVWTPCQKHRILSPTESRPEF